MRRNKQKNNGVQSLRLEINKIKAGQSVEIDTLFSVSKLLRSLDTGNNAAHGRIVRDMEGIRSELDAIRRVVETTESNLDNQKGQG